MVTADHFVTEIDKLRQSSDVVVLLGVPGTSLTDITLWSIIARDDHVDICTIQIPQEAECEGLDEHCFKLDLCQSTRARVGDNALIMGFPKLHREASEGRLNARVLPILDYVTDVGDRRFTIADENARREVLINPHNLSFPDHVGGMSGAPVFRVSKSDPPSLIGVLSEMMACEGLTFVLTRISFFPTEVWTIWHCRQDERCALCLARPWCMSMTVIILLCN